MKTKKRERGEYTRPEDIVLEFMVYVSPSGSNESLGSRIRQIWFHNLEDLLGWLSTTGNQVSVLF